MTTSKERRRYSREFKIEAVRRSYESGKPVTAVARELEISVAHLYRWRDDVKKLGESVYPGRNAVRRQVSERQELERLQRENERLREERDILKKTLVFFASEEARDIGSLKSTEGNSQ